MNDYSNIKPFRFWCQKVLPLVYDDSLSYYETLCKVQSKINEIIDSLKNINTDFENYINQKINELKLYVDDENAKQTIQLNNNIDEVNNKLLNFINTTFNEFVEETNSNFTDVYNNINKRIAEVYTYIDNADETLRALLLIEIDKLKEYVDNAILGKIIIFNPTKGYKEDIGKVINDIYDSLRYYGVTALEFDNYGITAREFDNYGLTASQFDLYSKNYFSKYYPHYLFDFENGNYDKIQNVMYRFVQTTRPDSITATNFDNKDITATNFDELNLSAFIFDTTANSAVQLGV